MKGDACVIWFRTAIHLVVPVAPGDPIDLNCVSASVQGILMPSGCLLMNSFRKKPPGTLHVREVLLAKSFDQVLFFSARSQRDQAKRDSTSEGEEPIRRHQGVSCNGQKKSDIKRVAYPTIRA